MKKTSILIAFSILMSLLFSGCVVRHPNGVSTVIVPSAGIYIRTGSYYDSYPIYRYNNDYYLYKHGRYVRHHHYKPKTVYINTGRYYDGYPIYKYDNAYYLKRKNGSYVKHNKYQKPRYKRPTQYERRDDLNRKRYENNKPQSRDRNSYNNERRDNVSYDRNYERKRPQYRDENAYDERKKDLKRETRYRDNSANAKNNKKSHKKEKRNKKDKVRTSAREGALGHRYYDEYSEQYNDNYNERSSRKNRRNGDLEE